MGQRDVNIRFIRYTGILVVLCLLPLLGYTFVFDPWQLFHKPWFRKTLFIENSRFQDAGLINSYDFDSVILGTSVAQNFSLEEATDIFSSPFMNLSIEGSYFSERAIILQRVLQKKDLKMVILSLDFQVYTPVGAYNPSLPPDRYDFLYNRNRLDDFRIYMNWKLFDCWNFQDKCFGELPGKRKESLGDLYRWESSTGADHRATGVSGWCASAAKPYVRGWMDETIAIADKIHSGTFPATEVLDKKYMNNLRGTFDLYVAPYVRENPEVTFLLFFPPYSRLRYAMLQQGYRSVFDLYRRYIDYVVTHMGPYANVKVFGFETAGFPDDLGNYDDVFHYGPDINSSMLHWMAQGKYELTTDNVDEYLAQITALADRYDILSVAEQFRQCLQHQETP